METPLCRHHKLAVLTTSFPLRHEPSEMNLLGGNLLTV